MSGGRTDPADLDSPRLFAKTFSAFRIRNYRLFMTGQSLSVIGTWVQRIAQDWLVLELTHSGTVLGLMQAFQYLPILLCGPWGGVLADRFDKRKLLLCTQALSAVMATMLGLVTVLVILQHALVRASDLRHIDIAFFNLNSMVGVLLMAFALADRFLLR